MTIEPIDLADVYPDDWREQGWCCRECAIIAWYGMSPELRRELHPAARPTPWIRSSKD